MSIVKPYTFVAGNKARANEVNEDFDVLYQQVNTNITDIANVEGDVLTLSSTKADINGSSAQRFAVADPVSSGDAVNKRTFFKQIGNSIDYIGGLTISKDSGSPNDTILIDPGAAYDSTKQVVLALDVLTSKQNTTQSASTTYYVYIIGNATGSTIDILISTEASVPTLPAGYTLYRKIGSYTTNSSSNIDTIVCLSNSVTYSSSQITALCVPDYSRAVSLGTAAGDYTIPVDAECFISMNDGAYHCTATCNGQPVYYGTNNVNYHQPKGSTFLAPKNSTVNLSAGVAVFKYYPLKGA